MPILIKCKIHFSSNYYFVYLRAYVRACVYVRAYERVRMFVCVRAYVRVCVSVRVRVLISWFYFLFLEANKLYIFNNTFLNIKKCHLVNSEISAWERNQRNVKSKPTPNNNSFFSMNANQTKCVLFLVKIKSYSILILLITFCCVFFVVSHIFWHPRAFFVRCNNFPEAKTAIQHLYFVDFGHTKRFPWSVLCWVIFSGLSRFP